MKQLEDCGVNISLVLQFYCKIDSKEKNSTKMGEIVTYANNYKQKFCQIKFADGNRILISIARDGIKILKMVFFGAIPGGLIFELKTEELKPTNDKHAKALEKLAEKTSEFDPLDSLKELLITCNSLEEAKKTLVKYFPDNIRG